MTIPIPSGYPDFGRYQAQATKIYIDGSNNNLTGTVHLDLGYVGDVPHLGAKFLCISGAVTAILNFYSDAAHSTVLLEHDVGMRANDTFARTLPVLGPYADLELVPGVNPSNISYKVIQAVTPYAPFSTDSADNIIFQAVAENHAVGTTTVDANNIRPGPATLYAELPAVASEIRLDCVSATGAVQFITRIKGNGLVDQRYPYLPQRHLQLSFVNPGPGLQAFTYSLTADSRA